MRCFRKRSMFPFLGFLITFLLFFNLYMDDGFVLEAEKRPLGETLLHPGNSERYVHTFTDLSNFSGAVNVTYRHLAGIPLPRKSRCGRRPAGGVRPRSDRIVFCPQSI
ncbi:Alpha-1,3-mannosyl-glycoprotein 4-beta-N-acetylglucosaminyltransferase C [Liparis tanakae]|uniref:Alpha-1,3-mannosyl-glycoprotein 4-beta-N-acetylglucosaminyltransferase C n=1 Tax=Liparis tanakae TaxID=230148 RepID=A0A4Z2E0N0_9TELE|nr:Alpha-1,3-mannosyl-glycoprotein 4-beta-N-acetylglucosaminyltransferase C [Liparis tanakae]